MGVDLGREVSWVKAMDKATSSALLIVLEGPRPHGSILMVRVGRGGLKTQTPLPVMEVREFVDEGIHDPSV